jgi:hypothetical protein
MINLQGSRENDNEHSVSVKHGEFLDQVGDYALITDSGSTQLI